MNRLPFGSPDLFFLHAKSKVLTFDPYDVSKISFHLLGQSYDTSFSISNIAFSD